MNIKDFKWTREPDDYTLTDDPKQRVAESYEEFFQVHFRLLHE